MYCDHVRIGVEANLVVVMMGEKSQSPFQDTVLLTHRSRPLIIASAYRAAEIKRKDRPDGGV